jgi:phosphoethanolamine N-methyltransferase
MNDKSERQNEYDDQFVARLELIYGEGFLSPGGADEVRELLDGFSIAGQQVLDIGCGTGGADVLLVQDHGAKKVIGIDVELPLIDRAIKLATDKNLTAKLEFILVDPGPLPFADESFDTVFSKDAILQIPDKPSLFSEVHRVLKPGGVFVAGDWLKSGEGELKALQEFLDASSFTSNMGTPATSEEQLQSSGFVEVQIKDRTAWLREETKTDNDLIAGEYKDRAIELIGPERYEAWLRIRRGLLGALESAELRPSHLRAQKPHRE